MLSSDLVSLSVCLSVCHVAHFIPYFFTLYYFLFFVICLPSFLLMKISIDTYMFAVYGDVHHEAGAGQLC